MDVPGPSAADLSVYEDTVEPCPCADVFPFAAEPKCHACKGAGYRLTKRIYRAKDLNLQAAEALLKAKDLALNKAANTLERAASLFAKLGHPQEAANTKAAAVKLREEAG